MQMKGIIGGLVGLGLIMTIVALWPRGGADSPLEQPITQVEQAAPPSMPESLPPGVPAEPAEDPDAEPEYVRVASGKQSFSREDLALMEATNVPVGSVLETLKIIASTLRPIRFHGRVVDQYGEPVRGVKILYSIDKSPGFGGPLRYTTKTNRRGEFSIRSKGAGLLIKLLTKEGYEFWEPRDPRWTFMPGASGLKHDSDIYTASNPFMIKAWKHGEPANLITGDDEVYIEAVDGTPYSLIFTDQNEIRLKQGVAAEADLIIEVWTQVGKGASLMEARSMPWSITIRAPGGGLIENDSPYQFLAPEAGYQAEWQVKDKVGQLPSQKFYLLTRQGSMYGGLRVRINPFSSSGGTYMRVWYVLNPAGSRNLYDGKNRNYW